MSVVAKKKIESAKEALTAALWALRCNTHDPIARKEARKCLAKCELLIKDARAAMRGVNHDPHQPKAEEQRGQEHDDEVDRQEEEVAEEVNTDGQ